MTIIWIRGNHSLKLAQVSLKKQYLLKLKGLTWCLLSLHNCDLTRSASLLFCLTVRLLIRWKIIASPGNLLKSPLPRLEPTPRDKKGSPRWDGISALDALQQPSCTFFIALLLTFRGWCRSCGKACYGFIWLFSFLIILLNSRGVLFP